MSITEPSLKSYFRSLEDYEYEYGATIIKRMFSGVSRIMITSMSMTLFQPVQNLGNSKSVWLSWRSSFAWASNGRVGLSLLQLMMSPNCGPMLSRRLKQACALLRMKGLRRGGCGGRCFSPSFGFWLQIIPGFCYQMQMVILWVASTWPGLFGDALTHVTQEPTLPRCP